MLYVWVEIQNDLNFNYNTSEKYSESSENRNVLPTLMDRRFYFVFAVLCRRFMLLVDAEKHKTDLVLLLIHLCVKTSIITNRLK